MSDEEIESLKLDGIYIIREFPRDLHCLDISRHGTQLFITSNHRGIIACSGFNISMIDQLIEGLNAIRHKGFKRVLTESEYIIQQNQKDEVQTDDPPSESTQELLSAIGLAPKPKIKIERRI